MVKLVNYEKASKREVNDECEPCVKDYKRSLWESLGLPNQLLKGDLEEEEYEKSFLPFFSLFSFVAYEWRVLPEQQNLVDQCFVLLSHILPNSVLIQRQTHRFARLLQASSTILTRTCRTVQLPRRVLT